MKKFLVLLFFLILTLPYCGGTYIPNCEKPLPGEWSRPERIIDYNDPQWGEGVIVLNTNLAGDYCYGYLTYVSATSGPVKVIPVPRENGKSIISGLDADRSNGILFTGERTERKLYAIDYKSGRIIVKYSLDRNPVGVKFLGNIEWKGESENRVVAVIGSKTPKKLTGALYLWRESDLIKGKPPFDTLLLNMGSPVDLVKIDNKIYVIPYSDGSLEEIDMSTGDRHSYSFPFSSLSWSATYAGYCPSIDRLCIASTAAEEILTFNYREGRWDGGIPVDFKPYNFQDTGNELYVTSHDPGGVYMIGEGKILKLLDVNGYSFVKVFDNKVFISLFNENEFRILGK